MNKKQLQMTSPPNSSQILSKSKNKEENNHQKVQLDLKQSKTVKHQKVQLHHKKYIRINNHKFLQQRPLRQKT